MKQFVGVTTNRRLFKMSGNEDLEKNELDKMLAAEGVSIGGNGNGGNGHGGTPEMAEPAEPASAPGIGIGVKEETSTQQMPSFSDADITEEMKNLESQLGLMPQNVSSLDAMISKLNSINEVVKREVLSQYEPSVRWIPAIGIALGFTTVDRLDQKQMEKLQQKINGHLYSMDQLLGTADTEINLLYKEQDKLSDLRQKSQKLSGIYDTKYTQLTAQYSEKEKQLVELRKKRGAYAEIEVLTRDMSHLQKERQEIMERNFTVQASIKSYFKRDIACKRQVALREKVKVKTFEAKSLFYQIKATYADANFGPPVGTVDDSKMARNLGNVLKQGEILQDYILDRAKNRKNHTDDYMEAVDGMTARSPASSYLKDEAGATNPAEIIRQSSNTALNKMGDAVEKLKAENQKMYEGY